MLSNSLWQTAFFLSTALAAPTSDLRARAVEPVPSCAQAVKNLRWDNPTPGWVKGAPQGSEFCLSQWETGNRVVGIAAFRQSNAGDCSGSGAINRLEVRFDNGKIIAMGASQKDCDAGTFVMAPNEIVKSLADGASADNPNGQGPVTFITDIVQPTDPNQKGQTTTLCSEQKAGDPGAYDPMDNPVAYKRDDAPNEGDEPNTQKVGGGIMIGLVGHVQDGGVFSHVNFIFSPANVTDITRKNYSYDMENIKKMPQPTASAAYVDKNRNNAPESFTTTYSHSREISHTTSSEITHQYTFGVSITAKQEISLLSIVDVSMEETASFQYSQGDTSSSTDVTTTGDQWTYVSEQNPYSFKMCTFSFGSAAGTYPYTADVVMTFSDHSTYSYKESGTIDANLFSTEAYTNCTESSLQGGSSSSSVMSSSTSTDDDEDSTTSSTQKKTSSHKTTSTSSHKTSSSSSIHKTTTSSSHKASPPSTVSSHKASITSSHKSSSSSTHVTTHKASSTSSDAAATTSADDSN